MLCYLRYTGDALNEDYRMRIREREREIDYRHNHASGFESAAGAANSRNHANSPSKSGDVDFIS